MLGLPPPSRRACFESKLEANQWIIDTQIARDWFHQRTVREFQGKLGMGVFRPEEEEAFSSGISWA